MIARPEDAMDCQWHRPAIATGARCSCQFLRVVWRTSRNGCDCGGASSPPGPAVRLDLHCVFFPRKDLGSRSTQQLSVPLVTVPSEAPASLHRIRAGRPTKLSLPEGATPGLVADCLNGLEAVAWLDAECPGGWRGTLLAQGIEREEEGSVFAPEDIRRLRGLIHAPRGSSVSGKGNWCFPERVVIGTVEFDGRFRFAAFSRVMWHDPQLNEWYGSRDLAEIARWRLAAETTFPEPPGLDFVELTRATEFDSMVARAKQWIAAGDIYQVNLARKYLAHWPASGEGGELALFQRLRRISPAPHAAFLDFGPGRRKVLSVSPETFLRFDGREVRTQPIKGTRPRGATRAEDLRLAAELASCPKERAELIMITDLLRNDLGQVCEYGSVRVPELLRLKRFSHVQHLVSTVAGRLRAGVDAWDVLAACSPGGSISGAPKRRALEVIAELEKEPRGLYTGSIGWLDGYGRGEFSIAIRTLVIESGLAHFHVGAGLVADSVAAFEFQETCHKAAGLLQACRLRTC